MRDNSFLLPFRINYSLDRERSETEEDRLKEEEEKTEHRNPSRSLREKICYSYWCVPPLFPPPATAARTQFFFLRLAANKRNWKWRERKGDECEEEEEEEVAFPTSQGCHDIFLSFFLSKMKARAQSASSNP
jgi:hypothetical protein